MKNPRPGEAEWFALGHTASEHRNSDVKLGRQHQTPKSYPHCCPGLPSLASASQDSCGVKSDDMCWKRQTHRDRKQISGCQELGGAESGGDEGAGFLFGLMKMFWN